MFTVKLLVSIDVAKVQALLHYAKKIFTFTHNHEKRKILRYFFLVSLCTSFHFQITIVFFIFNLKKN